MGMEEIWVVVEEGGLELVSIGNEGWQERYVGGNTWQIEGWRPRLC